MSYVTFAKRVIRKLGLPVSSREQTPFPDISPEDIGILNFAKPFTMTSVSSILSLISAVRYVVDAEIPGDIVECGVWRGGSMVAVAKTLLSLGVSDRHLYLLDTYEGMTAPTDADFSVFGDAASERFDARKSGNDRADWCLASLDEVQLNMRRTGYPHENIHFVKGDVLETLPQMTEPRQIALLRLDTDWYESTRAELLYLYPRLVERGILILDDYGHWAGSRKAMDEYVAANHLHLFLNRIDHAARIAVKPV